MKHEKWKNIIKCNITDANFNMRSHIQCRTGPAGVCLECEPAVCVVCHQHMPCAHSSGLVHWPQVCFNILCLDHTHFNIYVKLCHNKRKKITCLDCIIMRDHAKLSASLACDKAILCV